MSRSVHHANNLCAGAINSVEREVVAHDKCPGVWRNLGPCLAELRMVGQAVTSSDDPIDEAVGGGKIIQSHVKPNVIKVRSGARR